MTAKTISSELWYQNTEVTKIREYNITSKIGSNPGKPWIVLLHGFPTCSYDWYKMWPKLEQDYQLFAFDFLGFGKSDKPYPHRYSIIEQAEITLALLAQHEISSCYIIAHDYAVSVTQEMISRVQDNRCNLHIKKIILLNGGLFPEMHRARPIQKMLLGRFGRIVNALITKNSLRKNLDQVFGPDTKLEAREIDELWRLINFNNGKRVFHLLIKYILDRREHRDRWVTHMQETSIPIKLINGPTDPVSGRHLVERYIELMPDPDTVILEGIGHYPNLEAADTVSAHTISFFQ